MQTAAHTELSRAPTQGAPRAPADRSPPRWSCSENATRLWRDRRQVHFAVLVCRAVPLPASTCKSARLLTQNVRSPCQLCAASNPLQAGTVRGMQGTLASSRACAGQRAAAPWTRGTLSQWPQAPPARRQSAGPRSSGAACAYKAPGSLAHGRFTGRKQAAHAKLSLTSAY